MSVSFTVSTIDVDDEDGTTYVNVSNVNARDLLNWLGLEAGEDLSGAASVEDVAARCRRRLWPVARNYDAGRTPATNLHLVGSGPRVIEFGRRPNYLRDRTEQLLALCERAGTGRVRWG